MFVNKSRWYCRI